MSKPTTDSNNDSSRMPLPTQTSSIDDYFHYHRTCNSCGQNWWGLHCPHDGYQNPCPACDTKPAQVLLNPVKSDVCGCEFVIPISAAQTLLTRLITESKIGLLEKIFDEYSFGGKDELAFGKWLNQLREELKAKP